MPPSVMEVCEEREKERFTKECVSWSQPCKEIYEKNEGSRQIQRKRTKRVKNIGLFISTHTPTGKEIHTKAGCVAFPNI